MTFRTNPALIRLALGCIQPANASSVREFLLSAFDASGPLVSIEKIDDIFKTWEGIGDVIPVHKRLRLYSLTKQGNTRFTKAERRLRDRTRFFLLKEARVNTIKKPEAGVQEKADVSSAIICDVVIQEDERPIGTAGSPRQARRSGRAYWPLLAKQLFVGSFPPASGPNFRFLSFPSAKVCAQASGLIDIPPGGVGSTEIALALGVSSRLLTALMHKPESHYRTFEIPKANGKPRVIRAPRTMMKMVQYFLLDYFLKNLRVHESATAYEPGCSIRANALIHVGKKYVANIDVSNFFPSLSASIIHSRLCALGIKAVTAYTISRLCTYEGGLPQGAPTSAALSNIVLFEFDEALSRYCESKGLDYTRYADDISISGHDEQLIRDTIVFAEHQLHSYDLALNNDKTRIFKSSTRQIVTGVVVNEWPQPSRHERRKLRAALHQASVEPNQFKDRFNELQGYVAYMLSFSTNERPIGALPEGYMRERLHALKNFIQSEKNPYQT